MLVYQEEGYKYVNLWYDGGLLLVYMQQR